MVKIFTDSTADIPKKLADELDISIIPIRLHMEGETYVDGVTLTSEEFYKKLPEAKEIPTTSQPSPLDFSNAYKKHLEKNSSDEILSIHLASALSGTYQSAVLAKSMLEEENITLTVLDSKSATYGLGMAVVQAARAAKEGKSLSEVKEIAEYYIKNHKMFFTVETLEFIQKGGRIGKAAALLGTLLHITPILSLNKEGEVISVDKVRGKNRAITRVLELMQEEVPSGPVSLGVMHGNNEEGAKKWLEKIKEIYDVRECVVTALCPSIGTHAGPGTLACVICPEK